MLLFISLVLMAICQINGQQRPNIVMFLTDDQDSILKGMEPMKHVRKFIENEGALFVNSFVASPICCPSRATILTGLYPHNHGTRNNTVQGGCYGQHWKQVEKKTFATVLKEQGGYETFYAGKYLNQYGEQKTGGPEVVPPGWTEWHGLVGNSVYYNYTISNDGVPTHSDDIYLTDAINNLALTFIENHIAKSPFLMVLAPPAPHQPFTPAPRHKGRFANITAYRGPNFNVTAEDKHWLMRMDPSPLPSSLIPELDSAFRSRWESLLAVDEMVANVIEALGKINVLDNTYLIFTSDNGYHIGQFSQVYDKRQPYETDIRVPLIIRGPGIKKKTVIQDPTINVDLAPTIIKLAGLTVPDTMDGTPIDVINKDRSNTMKERNMLIEYYGEGSAGTVDASCAGKRDGNFSECLPNYACKCQDSRNNTYGCIRYLHPEIDFKYCIFSDHEKFEEAYDLKKDPYELHNAIDDVMPAVRSWYRMLIPKMLRCKGAKNCNHPLPSYNDI